MKKLLSVFVLSLVCAFCVVGFSACGGSADTRDPQIVGIYNIYVAYAEENGETPLSYDEWLASIKGENGQDGITPTIEISSDGFWIINGEATEIKAVGVDGKNGTDGQDGLSIKSVAKTSSDGLIDTYTITYSDDTTITFTVTNGARGEKGEKGDTGVGVKTAVIDRNGNLIITFTDDTTVNAGKVKDVHPHEIIETEIVDREPTCTNVGIKYVLCATCGELLRTVILEKAPHDYENVITPPTCTEQGYTTHTCKDCGHIERDTYTDIIPHIYADTVIPPTCTEQGYTTHTCTVCGYSFTDSYTVADTTEHNYIKNGEIYGNCALSMKQDYICTRCNHEKTEIITAQAPDAHNHLDIGDTCAYCGYTVYSKNGDNVLMKNAEDKLSAEFYGTETYTFDDSVKSYIINAYISDGVTSIGNNTFYNCSGLTSVSIPNSVTSIESNAFYNCSSLTSITIPNSVTSIGSYAFYCCSSLTSITIPNSITSIGNSAFSSCSSLTSVYYTGTLDEWCEIYFGGASANPLYYSDSGKLYINNKLLTEAKITSATNINSSAFAGYRNLTSITIPDTVTSIGSYAFSGCSSLTSVTIPDGVTSIGSYAFECSGLTSITIPDTVTSIGNYTFYNCRSLTSITIPNSVTNIGEYAFSGCSGLTSVTFANTSGWRVYTPETTWLSSSSLANKSIAAQYLKSDYATCSWYCAKN